MAAFAAVVATLTTSAPVVLAALTTEAIVLLTFAPLLTAVPTEASTACVTLPVLVKIDAKSLAAAVSAPAVVVPLPATSVTVVPTPPVVPAVPASVIFVIVSGRKVPSEEVRPCSANAVCISLLMSIFEPPPVPADTVPEALVPTTLPVIDSVNASFHVLPVANAVVSDSKPSSGYSVAELANTRPPTFCIAFS